MLKEITVQELKQLQDAKADYQIFDVREEHEYEEYNIGAKLIPMGEIMDHVEEIDKSKQVIIHCRSGKRSASVIMALEQNFGFTNLYNLKGGVLAWKEEIDK